MSTKNKIQTLKGFRDILPEQAQKRQWLKNRIIEVFELWGFDPLETPTLEPLELFKGQIGEDENLFFSFKDQGGRDVALRYDQTVPTCRLVGQNYQDLPTPFRRYQIQPAFRAEKPQKGRYREFVQCDADIFGSSSPLADAEMIALSLDIYRQLGFKNPKVLINDRELMKDLPYEAVVAIDKLAKVGEDGVISDMTKKGISLDDAKNYLNFVKNIKPNETIKVILNYLDKLGFDKNWYSFEPTIARSFSYSTGPIWEVVIEDDETSGSSVLGGERFDKLTERVSGLSIPATGFGLGFDRTLEAAEALGLVPDFRTSTQVLVTVFDKNNLDYSISAAQILRSAGINTEVYPDNSTKIGKQLKYANKKSIPFVVIIGDEEALMRSATLKNMITGLETKVALSELTRAITKN